MTDDRQLLARYVAEVSEEAFAELTRRYMALVYSAALRQVRNEQLAQDVTQVVFANLARKAASIPAGTVLAGWLHRDTRYTALDLIRAEARRLRREQQSVEMNASDPNPQPGWEEIRPLLDEVLTKLSPADRDALLLRYFEQRNFAGVGAALGASAEAARKRVDRALERLREQLVKRGITTTAVALGGALAAHAVETVPAGLVISLAASSAGATAPVAGSWLSNLMLMTKTKIAISAALLVGIGSTPLIIQEQALAAARAEQSQLQAQSHDLPDPTVIATRLPAGTIDIAARDRADLERLRVEAAALRAKIAEFAAQAQELAAASSWHKPGGTPLSNVLRPREMHDVGQATPEATMQSFMSAMFQGDTNRISQLLVVEGAGDDPTLQKALEKVLGESSNMRSDAHAADNDKIEVYLLEEQAATNNDRWVVGETRQDGAVRGASRILLRPTDTGWRCVVTTNGDPVEERINVQP